MAKIDEYITLRSEVLTIQQINASTTWSIVVASGVILGMGVGKADPDPFLFLSPLLLIVPGILSYAQRSGGLWRIGSYISVFHENSDSGLGWETRNWRLLGRSSSGTFASPYFRFISTSMLPGLGFICFLLAWRTGKLPLPVFLPILIAALAFFAYAMKKLVTVRNQYESCLKRWRQIKTEEDAKHAPEDTACRLADPQN